jgi:quinol monooxygenase YgiN
MYGTVARMRVKTGMVNQLRDWMRQEDTRGIPGYKTSYTYQMDADPTTVYVAIVFESREAYVANAQSPQMDAHYQELVALLEEPPEWHDGQIIFPQG